MKQKKLGCLTTGGLIAFLISMIVVGASYAFTHYKMFSPGELNSQSNGLIINGISSHAELVEDCNACHTAPWDSTGMAELCIGCHSNVSEELNDENSLHGVLTANMSGINCRECHTDHNGPTASMTEFLRGDFPHELVGFALQSHTLLDWSREIVCADCHQQGFRNFEILVCVDCHTQVDATFMAAHTSLFGTLCMECHDGIETYGADFDHDRHFFPLHGKHAGLDCVTCHQGSETLAMLQGTQHTCESCHLKDDVHQGSLGKECAVCHTNEGWKPALFGHSGTGFVLVGGHADLACENCHLDTTFQGAAPECISCHAPDEPHQGQFGTDCILCHTIFSWDDIHFDHSGAYAQECTVCHQSESPANHYPGQCSACHNTAGWLPVNFNHEAAGANNCRECHTSDSPANHYTGQCSACHSTAAWLPATFSHELAGATNCKECHTSDRPANHSTEQCSACHSTAAWLPATFSHEGAGATNCKECHTSDRPANHFSGQCSNCHNTNAWKPAGFNHELTGATDCQLCHTPDRPANHFTGQCSACHNTNAWKPAGFNHEVAGATDCQACHTSDRPANHFSGQCSACHNTNAWKPAVFNHELAGATDCQSCHTSDRPANHYSGQCSDCHSTSAWKPASFTHTFPIEHHGANGQCNLCHITADYNQYTCYECHEHESAKMEEKHKEVNNFSSNCINCHWDGRKHGD